MSGSVDRLTAARLLLRVEGGAFASRLLAEMPSAAVRTRVLGSLRWQRRLDAALAPLLRRPPERLDAEVRVVLRLGLLESQRLGVPAPVATDAAVHLVRRLGRSSAAGLVNAVLRRAPEQWQRLEAEAPPDLRWSHPAWLAERWKRVFGVETAAAILAANQEDAPLWVWWMDDHAAAELAAAGVAVVTHPWCPGAAGAPDAGRELAALVGQGRAWAQDPSSQLVANLAADLQPGAASVVDLCAAPGGKAALLARRLPAARQVALELRPGRGHLLRRLLGRTGGATPVVVADAGRPPLTPWAWDLVLLDAPCSGTGTLRRHPELRWRLQEEALTEMAAVQRRLLAAAAELLAPGGLLVYATCSLEPEENEDLLTPPPAGLVARSLDGVLPHGASVVRTAAGGVRILPSPQGDGFTVHALQRPVAGPGVAGYNPRA